MSIDNLNFLKMNSSRLFRTNSPMFSTHALTSCFRIAKTGFLSKHLARCKEDSAITEGRTSINLSDRRVCSIRYLAKDKVLSSVRPLLDSNFKNPSAVGFQNLHSVARQI